MIKRNVIFIPKPLLKPITGGEIYNNKIYNFIRTKHSCEGTSIEFGRIQNKNGLSILLNLIFIGIRNIAYLVKLSGKKNCIVIEDSYYSTDLVLYNILNKKRKTIIPIVHHLYHPLYYGNFSEFYKKLEYLFLKNSKIIITNSNWTKNTIIELIGNHDLLIANPGPNIKPLDGAVRKNNSDTDIFRIITVGSFTARKNYKSLLCAMVRVLNQSKNFILTIVGSSTKENQYYNEVLETIKNLNLVDNVEILSDIKESELSKLYESANIYASSSLYEGFGISILEAMSFSLPIVAYRGGAVQELIMDGVNGYIVDDNDYVALSEKILRLMNDDVLIEMSLKSYEFSINYSWDNTFNKIDKMLDSIR